ncbi:MAG: hypothetical protein JF886_15895 [Candidatus Dormibacteraeota bacterium]|uniref:Polysaccharide biosynthesis protein C-terminal domain-containing protein n=1 Tax=Candidatus Aeolococcus gillhamiae TaxID=3127015 RepID=A0A934K4Q6_9BACT|nr:hypothetical protein [Candidatus Dormibacteraeota bacterium]
MSIPSTPPNYARRMVSGVLSGTVQVFIARFVGLLTLPVVLSLLGLNLFGLWTIVAVVTNSQFLIDFGMASVITRFVAVTAARGDRQGATRILRMGAGFYLGLSLVVALILLPLTAQVTAWFALPRGVTADAQVLWVGGICLFAVSNLSIVLSATLLGLQRLSHANTAVVISQIPYASLLVVAMREHWGTIGLLSAVATMYVVQIAWMGIAVARYLPAHSPIELHERVGFGAFLRFGSLVQLANTADFYVLQAPKVVAGIVGGAASAARFDIALRLPMAAFALLLPLLPPLIPSAARHAAAGSANSLVALFARGTRYMAGAAGLIFIMVMIAGPEFLVVWLGSPGSGLAWPLRLLTGALLLYTLPGIITSMGTGTGQMRVVVQFKGLLAASITVALLPLHALAGITGIAAAVLAGFALSFAYLVLRADLILGQGTRATWLAALGRCAVACSGALLVGATVIVTLQAAKVPPATWAASLAAGATYIALAAYLRMMTRAEIGELFRSSPLAAMAGLRRRHL